MISQFYTALRMLVLLTILTGIVYPLVVTAIAQVVFPRQSNGSLLAEGEASQGSELIGQPFASPRYFWGRLSATTPVPYNGASSGGSNFGPLHPDLQKGARERIAALTADGSPAESIPVDLVTASGSGLDPEISPAAAEYQVARVAKARGIGEDQVRDLVRQHTRGRQAGLLGEPRVHVLRLNLALDALSGRK